jgi:hypothetical protein
MQRKLSIPVYLSAFLISLVIFVTGIYIGTVIDTANLQDISGEVSSVSEKVTSLQLLMLTEGNSSSFCPVYRSELDSIDQEVENIGYKLSYLEDERQVFDSELKKKYFLVEAESYLLSSKVNELCGERSVLLIHFYSNKGCERCREQGPEVLKARDGLVAQGVDIKLFSFDGELGSPVAESFERQYSVTSYPSIVIDGKTYPGFKTSEEIIALVKGSR